MNDKLIQELKQKAEELYRSGDYLCSEAVFTVVNEYLGQPLPPEAVRITSGFPVGIGHAGCTCGAKRCSYCFRIKVWPDWSKTKQ